jgi:hypothetical protein
MRTILAPAAVAALVLLPAGTRADEKHTHVGPHKGAVAVWGDEYFHLEVVPDPKAGTVTVYVYGDDDDLHKGKAQPIDVQSLVMTIKADKAVTLKLEPSRQKDDPEGKASVFTGKHDVFTKGLKLEGTISGKTGGKPYSGDFKQK